MHSNLSPNFFLGSGEQRDDWARIRACWVKGNLRDDKGYEYVWIHVDPPVIGQPYGEQDIVNLLITPHFRGTTICPMSTNPLPVYIYRISNSDIMSSLHVAHNDIKPAVWGELYLAKEEAVQASIETMS